MQQMAPGNQEDGKIHKQVGDKRAQNNAVGGKKKSCVKAEPADKGGIGGQQAENREIPPDSLQHARKFFHRKIKIEESAGGKRQKVQDQLIVVGILVNKADVQQDQDNVKRTGQPYICFFFCVQIFQVHKCHIQPGGQKYRQKDEDQKKNILIQMF